MTSIQRQKDEEALFNLLVYQPGTVWEYGLNFDVLGLVIESITKQPLGRYLDDNVWKPLGMVDTGFERLGVKFPGPTWHNRPIGVS